MEITAEVVELTERIRQAVLQHGGGTMPASPESLLRGELPPIPGRLAPPASADTSSDPGSAPPTREALLEEISRMIGRARRKNSVPPGVPAMLRPFYRNQGGLNGIVVETLEQLLAANQQLRQQNIALQDRLLAVQEWVKAATHAQARHREWIIAADTRLRPVSDARLSQIEERLRSLEADADPV